MSHNLKVVRIEDFLVNSRQLAFEMIDFAHFGPSGHLNDWLNTHLNEETEKKQDRTQTGTDRDQPGLLGSESSKRAFCSYFGTNHTQTNFY